MNGFILFTSFFVVLEERRSLPSVVLRYCFGTFTPLSYSTVEIGIVYADPYRVTLVISKGWGMLISQPGSDLGMLGNPKCSITKRHYSPQPER